MTAYAALALYPLLAISVLVAINALRLGHAISAGMMVLALSLAAWTCGLVLLEHPHTTAYAYRILPAGMILVGAVVHAGASLVPLSRPWLVYVAYAWGVVIGCVGLALPDVFFGVGNVRPGVLFWPMVVVNTVFAAVIIGWLVRAAAGASGMLARQRWSLAIAAICGTLGSGVVVAAWIFAALDIRWAALPLGISIVLCASLIVTGEQGRSQTLMRQGLAYTMMTAILSSVGLVAYYKLIPYVVPEAGNSVLWLIVVTLFAALPLDSARMLLVETTGRRLFRNPSSIRDLADEVTRTEVRADQAERLAEIGTMASAIAHEIRNPLGIIKAQAALLERKGADSKGVLRVRQQVDRAGAFLDELLAYSRPQPLKLRTIRADELLRSVIADVLQIEAEDDPEIVLEPLGHIDLQADAAGFRDVHNILLRNAVAAVCGCPDGRVVVSVAVGGGNISVAIQDNGPGVPPELTETLFQPFVTGRGRDSTHPGTGLGLAIAQRWVERHGGTIGHEVPETGGARFVVRWPLKVTDHG